MRKLSGVVAALAVVCCVGCGAEDEDGFVQAQEPLRQTCDTLDGVYNIMSALAVTAGIELRRWEYTDFAIKDGKLELSAAGLTRCSKGPFPYCDNVRAMLGMQRMGIIERDGKRLFDATQYNVQLKVYHERAKITWDRYIGQPWYTEKHKLNLLYTQGGLCGYDNVFALSEEGGDGGLVEYPVKIYEKLIFAGYPENSYMGPRVYWDQAIIDPDNSLVRPQEGDPEPPPGCLESCWKFDEGLVNNGQCCVCGGVPGVLSPVEWDPNMLVCTE